jgi:hypothetical protein
VLGGKVIDRCMRRRRHGEFICFLNTVEHDVAAGKLIHVVLDNYATHKHLESPPRGGDAEAGVLAWLYIALSALDVPLHPNLGLLAGASRTSSPR